jgi:hypothetical protein
LELPGIEKLPSSLMQVCEIIEPKAFSILEFEDDLRTRVPPSGVQALELTGLDGE